ncbi:MAG: hypothetical protein ACLTLQ_22260 [[Clostridium] scindens]
MNREELEGDCRPSPSDCGKWYISLYEERDRISGPALSSADFVIL